MKVTVFVTPKKNVLDPQGAAVEQAVHSMGHDHIRNVRIGKTIEFTIDAEDSAELRAGIDAICKGLLSNPVIEDYRYELGEG